MRRPPICRAVTDRAWDGWFAAQRPANLPDNIGFYGLGAYGENRSVYTAAQFADAASAERRTRHLGIDVFAPVGTPFTRPSRAGSIASPTMPIRWTMAIH